MYRIGQKFKINKITNTVDTIIDILKTYNSENKLVEIMYKSKFQFNGTEFQRKLSEKDLQKCFFLD